MSIYESSVTLAPDKNITRKEKYELISIVNSDAKKSTKDQQGESSYI